MAQFRKNVSKQLPYDREQYINFLDAGNDTSLPEEWFGISIQTNVEDSARTPLNTINAYEHLLGSLLRQMGSSNCLWVLNHDVKDTRWFYNKYDKKVAAIRRLFKKNKVKQSFRGCLLLNTSEVISMYSDLFWLVNPYPRSYQNLDISHSQIPLIIKLTGHCCIDVLSKHKALLEKLVCNNMPPGLRLRFYGGEALW